MIVYKAEKRNFMESVLNDTIASEVSNSLLKKMHVHSNLSQYNAFVNSLQYMGKVLADPQIPDDSGIAIEYNIPQTGKRIDFMISGYDEKNQGNVVIVELKQWDKLKEIKGKDGIVETFTGGALREVVHPSYQVWSYATLLHDYNETIWSSDINLYPCAYLHNYWRKENDPLDAPQYAVYYNDAPAFTRGEAVKLRNFIKKYVVTGDKMNLVYQIDSGKIRPSKSLQDAICGMVKNNNEFTMIDDQKIVYENILDKSRLCFADGKKRTIIVEGGPGTGKTVIAVNLLAELTREDQFCQYVSKNSAPRNVYTRKLKGTIKKSSIDNMFKGSGIYFECPENSVDTILVDEAHRLNEKSGMFKNKGENQIKEIIASSKCSVFFIDESQRITLGDIGSVSEIEKWANVYGSEVIRMELTSQFRCNGSNGYLAWIDHMLGIRETANTDLDGIDYDFRVFDTPQEMFDAVYQKNLANNKSRVVAGYCWNWISDGKNDSSVHDIVIGDFEKSWNLGSTATWAIDPDSINEIGCIHTCQGLEFDTVGVIVGRDLRFEHGEIITDFTKRASTDQSLKGIKKLYQEDPEKAKKRADEIIRNTYKVLMTRGMKGCYVYCEDALLREYLKSGMR